MSYWTKPKEQGLNNVVEIDVDCALSRDYVPRATHNQLGQLLSPKFKCVKFKTHRVLQPEVNYGNNWTE